MQADTPGEHETMNNITNNCHRDKDLSVSVIGSAQVKNINKKVDFHRDNGTGERNGHKARYPVVDYNLVHELKQEDSGKEEQERSQAKCEAKSESLDCQLEEKQRKCLKSDTSENRRPESMCKDTKYQSVYVISEEKDECLIATEV
ncbi:hypothetical protein AAFF_G00063370 [Aldrovandia affinis]|uniref:Uncharacterized protein n=1 Tax=Aldrovandia affinis TaxID=143900 RepID=A0AAD7RZN4_9TELE|nr:hypothetical protein AAFF_G00063370 [Aldrovandia affinis]